MLSTLYKCMEIINQIAKYRGVQGIYAIVNVNSKSQRCPYGMPYVGKATARPTAHKHKLGIGARLGMHRCELRKNIHHGVKLQHAWNKYGESSFMFLVVERVIDNQQLTEREQFWIDEWDSHKNGYNTLPFADSGLGHRTRSDLADDTIIQWIEEYKQRHGRFPTHQSGDVEPSMSTDEPITWQGVNGCLSNGFRGQEPGQSLASFIAKHFGIINGTNRKTYTPELILEWAEHFYKANGYYPTKRSGAVDYGIIDGYSETSWSSIDACLRRGRLGLPGGDSLHKLILEHSSHKLKYKSWYSK